MQHNNSHWHLVLLLFLLPGIVMALPADKDAPVEIEADSADIDQEKQLTIYRGNVKIRQGSMELQADKVAIQYQGRKPHTLTATGGPARFRQKPAKDKPWVKGEGRRIVYHIHNEELVLSGNAVLNQEEDSFRSDRIVYDRVKARLKAGAAAKGKERVKVIIHPQALK